MTQGTLGHLVACCSRVGSLPSRAATVSDQWKQAERVCDWLVGRGWWGWSYSSGTKMEKGEFAM